MSTMYDPESQMFTVFGSPEWRRFEAYWDSLPWFSDDPTVETQFTFLDKVNAAARAWEESPEGREEQRRADETARQMGEVGRACAAVIDREVLAVLTGEETP